MTSDKLALSESQIALAAVIVCDGMVVIKKTLWNVIDPWSMCLNKIVTGTLDGGK